MCNRIHEEDGCHRAYKQLEPTQEVFGPGCLLDSERMRNEAEKRFVHHPIRSVSNGKLEDESDGKGTKQVTPSPSSRKLAKASNQCSNKGGGNKRPKGGRKKGGKAGQRDKSKKRKTPTSNSRAGSTNNDTAVGSSTPAQEHNDDDNENPSQVMETDLDAIAKNLVDKHLKTPTNRSSIDHSSSIDHDVDIQEWYVGLPDPLRQSMDALQTSIIQGAMKLASQKAYKSALEQQPMVSPAPPTSNAGEHNSSRQTTPRHTEH